MREGGKATPLVLLHGIGSNARAWAGQFAGLQGERRILAWNAPGYAHSGPIDAEWPVGVDYAYALKGLLDHLDIDCFVLVGQSLGAIMASAFARLWPERVAGLMLASPATGYGLSSGAGLPAKLQARIDDLLAMGASGFAEARHGRLLTDQAPAEARDIVRQSMAEVETKGYTAAVRLLAVSNLAEVASALACRPVVAWGAADVVTPPESCRAIAQAARAIRAIEVPGLGHAFATEAPDHFNAILRPLLQQADSQTGAAYEDVS